MESWYQRTSGCCCCQIEFHFVRPALLPSLPFHPCFQYFWCWRRRERELREDFVIQINREGRRETGDWTLEKGGRETDLTWRGGQIIRLDMTIAAERDESLRSDMLLLLRKAIESRENCKWALEIKITKDRQLLFHTSILLNIKPGANFLNANSQERSFAIAFEDHFQFNIMKSCSITINHFSPSPAFRSLWASFHSVCRWACAVSSCHAILK